MKKGNGAIVGNQNIIVLNGKRYDTRTGKIIADSAASSPTAKKPHKTGASMDGFARRARVNQAKHAKPHHTQHSKTLMRTIVKKPAVAKSSYAAAPKIHGSALTPTVEAARLQRAKTVVKSSLVKRFGGTPLEKPAKPAKANKKPQASSAHSASAIASVPATSFHRALADATSHQQTRAKRIKLHHRVAHKLHINPRIISTGAAVLAIILIGGFFAYQNRSNVSMRIAAAHARIHGSLPSYHPAGFKLASGISYKPGQISYHFQSNTGDDRAFTVTQTASSWNSTSLHDNFVAMAGRQSQTVEDKGKTIYIYDNSNATWVDGGIWYQIEGNSQLNSDQLLHLAASL
jgi:hypothetical protein